MPDSETRTDACISRICASDTSSRSPGPIGAAITIPGVAVAPGGTPARLIPCDAFQTAGASFALGRLFFSVDCGMRATPVGRPDVLGVGACARPTTADAAMSASRTAAYGDFLRIVSRMNTAARPSHSETKRVIAINTGHIGRDWLYRLARVIDDEEFGSPAARRHARFLRLLRQSNIEIAISVCLLPHCRVRERRFTQLQAGACGDAEALASTSAPDR